MDLEMGYLDTLRFQESLVRDHHLTIFSSADGWEINTLPTASGDFRCQPISPSNQNVWNNPDPLAEENLRPRSLTLTSDVPLTRLDRRAKLRKNFDKALRYLDKLNEVSNTEGQFENALRLLAAPQVRGAFDLTKEDASTRDHYGRTKIGGRCLMARRLVEAGARFVMVDYGYDLDYGNLWDNHAVPSQKQPFISEMCKRGYHLAGTDQACAALISDLEKRGLLDNTLVVFLTEFGRTPRINKGGGRDHWGRAGSIFFAGAGTPAGQVIGAMDKHAADVTTHGYTPADVAATIYRKLGIDHSSFVTDYQGRPRPILDAGTPIPEIFS